MVDKEWIKSMIVAHADHWTQKDLVEECGCSATMISTLCKELEITLVKSYEQKLLFVKDMHMYKTKEELAKLLDVGLSYVEKMLNELGVECTLKVEVKIRRESIASRLASVTKDIRRSAGADHTYEYQGY